MPPVSQSDLLDISAASVHTGATLIGAEPYHVVTSPQQWSYALSFPASHGCATTDTDLPGTRTTVEVLVKRGSIGIGWTTEAGDAYLTEKFTRGPRARITLILGRGRRPGRLVFRNAEPHDTPSEFVVEDIRTARDRAEEVYPGRVSHRELPTEGEMGGGGVAVFDSEPAAAINSARIRWLESVDLPVAGKRVLDAGAGVGHFAHYYLERGCTITAIDGRAENIEALRSRHPQVQAHVADVQRDLARFGMFDVVHCFGLLYHLESPIAALRNLHAVCEELLILETMVCDSSLPVTMVADEPPTANQALEGLGCRPSPSFIVLALNRVGFPHVYGATVRPRHPDFEFTWRDNLDISRDGHNLRCMFVASRTPLHGPVWVPLLDE